MASPATSIFMWGKNADDAYILHYTDNIHILQFNGRMHIINIIQVIYLYSPIKWNDACLFVLPIHKGKYHSYEI